jgi:hypothetical protein
LQELAGDDAEKLNEIDALIEDYRETQMIKT